MAHQGSLPPIHRYITTHNSEGRAVFSGAFPELADTKPLPNNSAAFTLSYATKNFPTELNSDIDLGVYKGYLRTAPGLVISNGTVLRHVDISPGFTSAMHRTVSLDYGVVLEGEVELILDSGETRVLKRGVVAIQRGTVHAWRNTSQTEWARMMYVLQSCKPIKVAGKTLEEDLETMVGVPPSE
jgi:quercetin dioxygenase-like cupin family protein